MLRTSHPIRHFLFAASITLGSSVVCIPSAYAQTAFDTAPYVGLGIGYGKMTDTLSVRPDARHRDLDRSKEHISAKKSGLLGSVYAGYNWRFDRFILGLEADITGGSLKHHYRSDYRGSDGRSKEHFKHRVSWFATLRPRAGYLINDSLMVYGTAGFATGRVKSSIGGSYTDHTDSSENFTFSANKGSRSVHGWAIGAGLEYAVNDHWHIRGEYLHTRFNRKKYNTTATSSEGQVAHHHASIRPRVNQFRIGMTYRF